MKKIINKVKGFTLTELAIVIAVIAILVAVLVPTFISLINKANESSDMQLVSNLNTSLSIAGTPDSVETDDGTIYNVTTAITSVRGDGYDVSKITPTADGGDIVYNATKNKFVYYAEDFTDLAYGEVDDDDVLVVITDASLSRLGIAESAGYSVQYCVYTTDENVTIENNTESKITVWVYSENNAVVNINLPAGTVYHDGSCYSANIICADDSYHAIGKIEYVEMKQGRYASEDKGEVKFVYVASENSTNVKIDDLTSYDTITLTDINDQTIGGKEAVNVSNVTASAEEMQEALKTVLELLFDSEVTKEPTCTEEGVKTYTCVYDASIAYTEAIAKIAHSYGEYETSWSGHYLTITHTCSECSGTETVASNLEATYEATYAPSAGYTDSEIDGYTAITTSAVDVYAVTYEDVTYRAGEENSNWTYTSGTTTLTKYKGGEEAITIPTGTTTIGTGSSSVIYYGTKVKSVIIPDCVTAIGDKAFQTCSGLTNVTIGDGVETIGAYAFSSCSKLTSLSIGKSVTSLGNYAFSSSTALTEVYYNAANVTGLTNRSYIFDSAGRTNGMTVTIGADVESIPGYLFYYSTTLTSNSTPNITKLVFEGSSCTSISNYAFCCTITEGVYIKDISAWCGMSFGTTYANPLQQSGKLYLYSSSADEATQVTSLVIPDSVTSISAYAFYGLTTITSLTIGKGVTTIGNDAFYNCTGLTEINFNATSMNNLTGSTGSTNHNYVFYKAGQEGSGITVNIGANVTKIPNYLFSPYKSADVAPNITSVNFADNCVCTTIGIGAFKYCKSLLTITIPSSITTISSSAFQYCSYLIEVCNLSTITLTIGGTDNGYVACYAKVVNTSADTPTAVIKDNTNSFIFYKVTEGNAETYYLIGYAGSSTELTLPETLTVDGETKSVSYVVYDSAFYKNTTITGITIGDNVTAIEANAFSGCTKLATVTISDKVTSIGESAFYGCTALKEISMPAAMTEIAGSTFYGCTSLATVTIGSNVETINSSAFYGCTALENISIPSGITSIGSSAFYGCTSLETITFEDNSSLETIGGNAFNGCTAITKVELPAGVTSIGVRAFYGCSALEEINIPDRVTSIQNDTFSGCTSLASITLPEGLQTIMLTAFESCTSLTSINIPASVTSIASDAFAGCSSIASITVADGNSKYIVQDNTMYALTHPSLDETDLYYTLFLHANASGTTSITIPEKIGDYEVRTISSYAFYGNTSLTSIDIPDNITYISDHAFEACTALESVTIGSGCYKIGQYAFYNCTALKTVVIEDGETELEISTYAFAVATTKTSVLESIVLPKRVTEIRYNAFECCKTVTVYYCGTTEDESAITSTDVSGDSSANGLSYYFEYEGNTIYYYAESGSTTETGNYWYYDANGDITPWSISDSE